MFYIKKFTLEDKDFDNRGNVYPFSILDVFEKSATEHGEIIGVGAEKMAKENLYWIISGLLYQVTGSIKPNEELTIKTWPLEPKRLAYRREYLICNSVGEVVIKGSANWLTIDREKRKLVIGADIFPPMEYLGETNFEGKIPRLRDFADGKRIMDIIPEDKHIDLNGHVNNKHYTTFILDALGSFNGTIDTFQIEYAAEIMPEDKVSIYILEKEKEILAKGESEKLNFSAKIIYK